MAKECVKFCYARKGAYTWSNVSPAFEKRYELTKTDDFVPAMIKEIKTKKAEYIRVHDSGDFYSPSYMAKWFEIAAALPNVRFYAYTNMVDLVSRSYVPDNFDFIFSNSGKQKRLINKRLHRHTEIFSTKKELSEAGYTDASSHDLYATKWFSPDNHKVGLIYH